MSTHNWQIPPQGGHMDRPSGIYLQNMTWKQVAERLEKNDLIIVPVGSTEAHGPHACLGEDTFLVTRMAEAVAERTGCTVAQPVWYGSHPYNHLGMPGTVVVPEDAFLANLRAIIAGLRFKLDLYINLRPIRLYDARFCPLKDKQPEDIDFVVVRENNEGLYTGAGGFVFKGTPHEIAVQESVNTRRGIERCLRFAFDYARKRRGGRPWRGLKLEEIAAGLKAQLTLCGKTNVLTYAFDLWERAFHEIGQQDYPDIKRDYAHVDATTMWFVKNPEWFDVIVTDNMFGDIITDLGAMIQGGMGIAAGGNLNPQGTSMFEPIGGSAPKYTGQNVINPLAAICAGAMMMDFLGETDMAAAIENAVIRVVREKLQSLAAGRMGYGTREVGDLVASAV